MKSIKPGRMTSTKGFIASIAAAVFGVFWCIVAASIGGYIMIPFGLIFIFIAIVEAVISYKNATSKERYSLYDITEGNEEPDPLNRRFGGEGESPEVKPSEGGFCPHCGNPVDAGHKFCRKCGGKL